MSTQQSLRKLKSIITDHVGSKYEKIFYGPAVTAIIEYSGDEQNIADIVDTFNRALQGSKRLPPKLHQKVFRTKHQELIDALYARQ